MKKLLFSLLTISQVFDSCKKADWSQPIDTCSPDVININYKYADTLQSIINKYTKQGVPGVAIAVYDAVDGYWAGASGYASIEKKIPMQTCNIQYAQSVTKTYLAVALLQMQDQKLINLDNLASVYMPAWINQELKYMNQLTVRMLMNQTTGIADYANDSKYVIDLVQNPLKRFTAQEFISYIKNKSLNFTPGNHHEYSNTNYLLLALLVDNIVGDHAKFIQDNIFKKLNLLHTFYRKPDNSYINQSDLVNSYWDRFSNGALENVTQWEQVNVSNSRGDDGLIASPLDFVKFIKALFNGQLISNESLNEMKAFAKDENGDPAYGLGLEYSTFNNIDIYGHTGGGIGAGCALYYIPSKQVYVFFSTNMGTLTQGPLVTKAEQMEEKLLAVLLQ